MNALRSPVTVSLCLLLALLPAAIAAGCVSSPSSGTITVPATTGALPGSSSCGLTPCHGLDLSCSADDAPQACTMEYQLGDKCRQYAHCGKSGSACTIVYDPQFADCRACAEKCAASAGTDAAGAFDCEAKC